MHAHTHAHTHTHTHTQNFWLARGPLVFVYHCVARRKYADRIGRYHSYDNSLSQQVAVRVGIFSRNAILFESLLFTTRIINFRE